MTNWRDDKRQPGETAEQHKARMRAKVEAIHERYSGEPTEADMERARIVRWGPTGKPPDAE